MLKNKLKTLMFTALMIGIVFALMQTAMAAGAFTFRTTYGVNMRSGASQGASVVRTVDAGATVEVLSHNPDGWSRVRVGSTTGFIRSDFLFVPASSLPATFTTTSGVNMRSGASQDASVLRTVDIGATVEVLAHNPAGWSRVRVGSTTGFIRSDFLAISSVQPAQSSSGSSNSNASTNNSNNANSAATAASTSSYNAANPTTNGNTTVNVTPVTLWTTADVNVRSSASTNANIVTVLNEGTEVSATAVTSSAWSRVRVGNYSGYIRMDLLRGNTSNVELIEWSVVRNLISNGQVLHITDVRSGETYNVRVFTRGRHADVEAVTQADSDTIRRINGGSWTWERRPVWVTFDGRTVAASINAMPHGQFAVQGNGMNGHICLHFLGSENHNGSASSAARHQANVMEAFAAGQ